MMNEKIETLNSEEHEKIAKRHKRKRKSTGNELKEGHICHCCETNKTVEWRRFEGEIHCNSCALLLKNALKKQIKDSKNSTEEAPINKELESTLDVPENEKTEKIISPKIFKIKILVDDKILFDQEVPKLKEIILVQGTKKRIKISPQIPTPPSAPIDSFNNDNMQETVVTNFLPASTATSATPVISSDNPITTSTVPATTEQERQNIFSTVNPPSFFFSPPNPITLNPPLFRPHETFEQIAAERIQLNAPRVETFPLTLDNPSKNFGTK